MSIVGNTYLERGRPVVVLAQWRRNHLQPAELTQGEAVTIIPPLSRWVGRNVLIRRAGGELVVRPFRGLRKP